jgi:hypothetical protein
MVAKLLNGVALPSAHSSLVGSVFSLVLFSFTCLLACFVLLFSFFSTAALVLAYLVRSLLLVALERQQH